MVRSVEYAGIHIRRVLFGMGGGGTAWSRGGRTVSCVRIKETFRKFMVCIYIYIYIYIFIIKFRYNAPCHWLKERAL